MFLDSTIGISHSKLFFVGIILIIRRRISLALLTLILWHLAQSFVVRASFYFEN